MAVGRLEIIIDALIGDALSGFQEMEATINKFSSDLTKAGKELSLGITAPLAAAGAGALFASVQIDEAMGKIRAGTGATGANLEALRGDFEQVFTSVPVSAAEAGTAIADLNTRLGLTGKPLQEIATQLLNLSDITGTDVTENIRQATRLFGDWSVAAEDQSATLDKLFRATQTTGVEFATLSRSLVQFGAPLREVGFSLEQSAALMGKWEKEGVNMELVMGGLRQGLSKMAKAGIEPQEGLQALIARIQELGPGAEATGLAMKVFGVRAGVDMARAILEGRFAIDEMVASIAGGTDTINAAAGDTERFKREMFLLKNELTVVAGVLGEDIKNALLAFLPAFKSALGVLRDLVQMFSALPAPVKLFVGGLLAAAAAIGPILLVLGKLIALKGTLLLGLNAVGFAATTLGAGFSAMLLPVIAIVAAFTAAVTVAVLVYRHWDAVRKVLGTVLDAAVAFGIGFIKVLRGLAIVIASLFGVDLRKEFESFVGWVRAIGKAFEWLDSVVTPIMQNLLVAVRDRFVGNLMKEVERIEGWAKAVGDKFKWLYDFLVGQSVVPDMVKGVGDWMAKMEGGMTKPVSKATKKVSEEMRAMAAAAIESAAEFARLTRSGVDGFVRLRERAADLTRSIRDMEFELALAGKSKEAVRLSEDLKRAREELARIKSALADMGTTPLVLAEFERQLKSKKFNVEVSLALAPLTGDVKIFEGLGNQIRATVAPWTEAVMNEIHAREESAKAAREEAESIPGRVGAFVEGLRNFVSGITEIGLGDILDFFSKGLENAGRVVLGFGKSILNTAGNMAGKLISVFNPLAIVGTALDQSIRDASGSLNEQFGPALSRMTQVVGDALTPVMNALVPLFDALVPIVRELAPILSAVAQILVAIIKGFLPIIKALLPLIRALFPVFKLMAIMATYVGQAFAKAAQILLAVMGGLAIGIGTIIRAIGTAIDKIPFMSDFGLKKVGDNIKGFGKGLLESSKEMGNAFNELGKAREEIKQIELEDPIDEVKEGFGEIREVTDEFSEATVEATNNTKMFSDALADATQQVATSQPQVSASTILGKVPLVTSKQPVTSQISNFDVTINSERRGTPKESYRMFYSAVQERARVGDDAARAFAEILPAPTL